MWTSQFNTYKLANFIFEFFGTFRFKDTTQKIDFSKGRQQIQNHEATPIVTSLGLWRLCVPPLIQASFFQKKSNAHSSFF